MYGSVGESPNVIVNWNLESRGQIDRDVLGGSKSELYTRAQKEKIYELKITK